MVEIFSPGSLNKVRGCCSQKVGYTGGKISTEVYNTSSTVKTSTEFIYGKNFIIANKFNNMLTNFLFFSLRKTIVVYIFVIDLLLQVLKRINILFVRLSVCRSITVLVYEIF